MLRNSLDAGAASRFQIVAALGRGEFGAVHEAIDLRSGQRVAVKHLGNKGAGAVARFKHEFRALADCHHPNLVSLKELIEDGGEWSIVMELVPGSDFRQYVRGERAEGAVPGFDEGRLRSALAGVVEGLRALHGYGILHRDLKPTNVRVRPDGRAVLLDFGLAASLEELREEDQAVVGTARYMAPEQAAGGSSGPAADVYALGVCLFEALTGRTPFDGDVASVLARKQLEAAPRASLLDPAVPADLDALCARMLELDPAARPSLEDVLAVLGGDGREAALSGEASAGAGPREVFAGREQELEQLERALLDTHRGELRIVLVEGESGVGKSELVAEFLRRAATTHPKLLALRGRCYENEQVSYKAFDGCIDELSKVMSRMPEQESAALLPVRAHLLAQLFPVLRNIRAIARAPRDASSAELSARRLEAFQALASLLAKLAADRPVVLVVDDLQWADSESFRLLGSLVEKGPPLLLLATIRPRSELEPEVLAQVKLVRSYQQSEVVQLAGLPPSHAKVLAQSLLGADASDAALTVIADESGGHPLFLRELVEFVRTEGPAPRRRLTLDAALRARIERLAERPRALIELVVLAARPHAANLFAHALSVGDVDEPARVLLAAKLLRSRRGQELYCFHDRIRRAVMELIPASRSASLHRRLAEALDAAHDADPVEQAQHWDLAGDRERAIEAYRRAVARARETLAFSSAARLCARAIDLIGNPDHRLAQELAVERAHSLACIGHSAEAAVLYERAAERAQGELRIRLRSRSAQQLMLSGNVARGFSAAIALLRELGVSVPTSSALAILRVVWDRLCLVLFHHPRLLALRGKRGEARRKLALEAIDELSHGMWLAQPLTMLTLGTQQLRLSGASESKERRAISETTRGWLLAIMGSYDRSLALFDRSRALLEGSTDAARVGLQAYTEGSARIAGFDWAGGEKALERSLALVQEHCPDWPWLVTNIRYHLSMARFHLGQHRRLAQDIEQWLAEARESNNALAVALLTGLGHGFARHLMDDNPEAALAEREQSLVAISPEPYSFIHFGQLISKCYALMYQGGPACERYLESYLREHGQAPLLNTRMPREVVALHQQFAALHAARDAQERERGERLAAIRGYGKVLARGSPLLQAYSNLALAQVLAVEGRREQALEQARMARAQFERLDHFSRYAGLFLEGALEGGARGREKRSSALRPLEEQGYRAPLRFLSIYTPLLPLLLERDSVESGRSLLLMGRYELSQRPSLTRLGGAVAARDVHTGRDVALKELARCTGEALEAFKREFRALQDLHHENIGRVDALFEHEQRWYIAMELVEGSDFTSYVRPHGRLDVAKLVSALLGIGRALLSLHDAGLVHRDVRPENIRVTREGRAVLIGFGSLSRTDDESDDPKGTSAYGAPEQLRGEPPHPSADVYALGMCLREALHGSRALGGTPANERVLAELEGWAARMIDSDPRARPSLAEIVQLLGAFAPREAEEPRESEPHDVDEVSFAGRGEELERLAAAFERTCDHGFTLLFVEGESGLGKSALVTEFARRSKAVWPSLQLLSGRCYENEQLAFKAFDGAVDHLARILRSFPNPRCEALMPKNAALLAQLFPVLSRVPAIAEAPKRGIPADPAAQKSAARECFLDLLENLSKDHELLFVVDDLQWADAESFALLRAMIERRERLPLLFLCTVRARAELSPAVHEELAALRALPSVEVLPLVGLGEAAASELAHRLTKREIGRERVQALVRESKGHPLFLRELIRYEQRRGAGEGELTLDAAILTRVAALARDARELLELVALAGRPLGEQVFAQALGREELARGPVVMLLSQGLVRRRGAEALTSYHDRVRHVVLAALPEGRRRELAEKLAAALEDEKSAEPAERARLWEEAGAPRRASDAYEQAGDRALESFAFARAEEHYARALAQSGDSGDSGGEPRIRHLLEQRAEALVRGGRSREAADLYLRAAERAQGEAEVRLRTCAAQHLILSARVDEGLSQARSLLKELGAPLPRSDRGALMRVGMERTRIALRRGGPTAKSGKVTGRERLTLETLHGLISPVSGVSFLPGHALVMQYLTRALRAGEPLHMARALAFQGLSHALGEGTGSTALLERARGFAQLSGEPAAIAEVDLLTAISALVRGELGSAPALLANAHELVTSRCPGQPYLLTSVRMYLGSAWSANGDYTQLAANMTAWIAEAKERDDRFALASLAGSGCGALRHLLSDRAELALEELREVMAPWPAEPPTSNHFGAFYAEGYARCYAAPEELLEWLDRGRRERSQSFLMRSPVGRYVDATLTCAGSLARLLHTNGREREALLGRAEDAVAALRKSPRREGPGMAALFSGVVAGVCGDEKTALRRMQRAVALLAPLGSSFAVGAQYLEGTLEGGEKGRSKRDRLTGLIRAQGWADPQRALRFRVPGLYLLGAG